ncbi:MAG: GAF domain-containing protein [Anaerolineae bacterium]|nr:GAF domain-containing protein [Chloroflexota bacterium]MBP6297979.1 GAF domain-containing protein [Anaerolineae bacterium]
MIALLNPRGWPYWLKLTLTLVIVLAATSLFLISSFEAQAREEADDRLRQYLQQTALTRRERLQAEIENAFVTFADVANAAYLRPRLLRVLQFSGTPSGADIVARIEATDLLRFRLVENDIFEYVRVLTPEGIVAASVFTADMPAEQREVVGSDSSASPGFRGALDAQTLGEAQRLIVYTSAANENQAEVVQVLEIDEEVVGFMIGRLNLQNTLVSLITDVSATESDLGGEAPFSIVSYLATRTGAVITDASNLAQAEDSAQRAEITLALSGQSGFSEFLPRGFDSPVISYYQQVENTPLALITDITNTRQGGQLTLGMLGRLQWMFPALVVIGAAAVALMWRDTKAPVTVTRKIIDTGLLEEMEFEIPTTSRGDMFGQFTRDLLNMRQRFQESYRSINARLEASLRDVEATQEVGRFVSTQRDQQTLMEEVVNLIVNVFPNIYHAQIFLNDKLGEFSVLRASTGEVGRRLLERGHRLPIGGTSVIGRTIGEGSLTAVLDTEASEVHRKNELLPNTRAELAIPLRLGKNVIGALDVQSLVANSFTEDQTTTLQAMADQIAISIENARLYQESVHALEEIAKQNRETTGQNWREHLYNVRTRELVAWSGTPTRTDTDTLRQQAIKTGVTQIGGITANRTIPVAVPIKLRGQILGAVVWELPTVDFSDEKIALAEELVNRLSVTLDNARLFEESQRTADRERVLNEIAAKITAQSDVEAILTTAVKEVGQALRTRNVRLRLGVEGSQRRSKSPAIIRLDSGGSNGSHE